MIQPNMEAMRDLLKDGASLYPNALSPELVSRLRPFCNKETANYRLKPNQRQADAAPVYPWIPEYKEVIQAGVQICDELGFQDVRWLAGALIPKWQGEGRRGWHIDFWGWESTRDTWRETPPQIGILFYLDDATIETGALIYAPGSHRRELAGHHQIWESWEFFPGEKTLEAKAGDCVLLDPRALHAVSANTKIDQRNCLTMWYLLDYNKLERGTRATCMLGGFEQESFKAALGPLAPTFEEGDFRQFYFPHCKKPQFPINFHRIDALRGGRSDRAILGSAGRAEDIFLDEFNTYAWYFAIGAACAPLRIAEFGVKWGYSLLALAKGAQWAGVRPELLGIDAEADGSETNTQAQRNIANETGIEPTIIKDNTRTMSPVLLEPRPDLIHVDGDHSIEGIARELSVAEMQIKPSGVILIDDIDVDYIRDAAVQLGQRLGIQPIFLPTQHGLALIDMKKRTRYERFL